MHPITTNDVYQLTRYNLKNNSKGFLKSLLARNGEYYYAWVNGKKVFLRKGKTDILVFKKIFIDKEYDFNLPFEVTTIIDAGANVGLSSIFFANKFPNARIIAVEPEMSNFKLLERNMAPYQNVYPLLGGISGQSGTFKIKNENGDHWNFMLEVSSTGEKGDGTYFTIEDIMSKYGLPTVDFLKIDIEGGEQELFKGNCNWLTKVKSLSIELHDFILPGSSNPFFRAISQHTPFSFINHGENNLVIFRP